MKSRTHQPRPDTPLCRACAYPLAGLPHPRCPECGRDFDPADARTFITRRSMLTSRLASVAPPRWLNIAFALVVVPLCLLLCSPTGQLSDFWRAITSLFVVVTFLAWSVPFLAHLGARAHLLIQRAPQPRPALRWLIIPILLTSCIALQDSGLLWSLRWSLARSGFQRAVNNPAATPPRFIGTFHIRRIEHPPDGTVRFILGLSDIYSQGAASIVYSPDGPPAGFVPIVHDIGSGWWVCFDNT
jgi:hypothetical protein